MKKFFCLLGFFAAIPLTTQGAHAIEVVFETDSRIPLVYLNVALRAGSVNDPPGKTGLSNFMAEMLRRGTKFRTKEQIDLAIDQLGARLAVETRAEALVLRGAVLTTALDPFLELIFEILTSPEFPEDEIQKLRSEIASRLFAEQGNDASLAARRFNQFLFRDHPYGKPISGTIAGIESITRDDLRNHYEALVHDGLLLIIGTGDTKKERIERWARSLAKARPTPKNATKTSLPAPQDAPTRRLLLVDKPERTQTQILVGQIGLRLTDDLYFPLYVANHAFGGRSFSARLTREIRVKRGWSYGANSFFRMGLQPRSWNAYLFPAAKDTPEALRVTLGLIEDLKQNGLTPEEFDFAQTGLINRAGFMFDTPAKRVENALLEHTLNLPSGFMQSYGKRIGNVSLEKTNSALKHFLKPERLAITVLCTAQDLKEPLAKVAGVAASDVQVKPYTQEEP